MKGSIDEQPTQAIFLEFAEKGTLFTHVATKNGLSEEEAHFFFTQLISVVEVMHNEGIVHRDIKLENVLLDGSCNVFLCDFGNAIFLNNMKDLSFIPSAGT